MFGKFRDLINRIDNHTDMLDALTQKVESAITSVRRHFGY